MIEELNWNISYKCLASNNPNSSDITHHKTNGLNSSIYDNVGNIPKIFYGYEVVHIIHMSKDVVIA